MYSYKDFLIFSVLIIFWGAFKKKHFSYGKYHFMAVWESSRYCCDILKAERTLREYKLPMFLALRLKKESQ